MEAAENELCNKSDASYFYTCTVTNVMAANPLLNRIL